MSNIILATICALACIVEFQWAVDVERMDDGYGIEVHAPSALLAVVWAALAGWFLWTA